MSRFCRCFRVNELGERGTDVFGSHHLFNLTLEDRLFLAPIPKTKLDKVLDVGTGTALWVW
jgi:hypothetical protein